MASFDWIAARHKCSLEQVFHTLKEVLDSDVKSFNGLGIPGAHATIRLDATNKIIVSRSQDYAGIVGWNSVVFELLPTEISVKDGRSRKPLFSAKPSLSAEGECLLEIDGQPHRLWQVNRKALDDLLFGTIADSPPA